MGNTITYGMLRRMGACGEQRRKFLRTFGRSVNVTKELAILCANEFDWGWAGEELLTSTGYEQYVNAANAAYRVYEDESRAANREYDEKARVASATLEAAIKAERDAYWAVLDDYRSSEQQKIDAREKYTAVSEPARTAYNVVVDAAQAACNVVLEPALRTLNQARAAAFAEAFLAHGIEARDSDEQYTGDDEQRSCSCGCED